MNALIDFARRMQALGILITKDWPTISIGQSSSVNTTYGAMPNVASQFKSWTLSA